MEVGYVSLEKSLFAFQAEELCQIEADFQQAEFNKRVLIIGTKKSFSREQNISPLK
jgi:hypothetical protein